MSEPKTAVQSSEPVKGRGPKAKQIQGMPDCWSQTLFPCRIPEDGSAAVIVNMAALAAGVKVSKNTVISYYPVQTPRNGKGWTQVRFCVKVCDLEEANVAEIMAVLHMIFMDNRGQAIERYTHPINTKDGIQFNFEIPLGSLDVDEPLTLALKVTLMSESEEGEPLPVLVRSAWLEAI